jgi:hypothetical protein
LHFESELLENESTFILKKSSQTLQVGLDLFCVMLTDQNRQIVIENGIIASTETNSSYDYRDQ